MGVNHYVNGCLVVIGALQKVISKILEESDGADITKMLTYTFRNYMRKLMSKLCNIRAHPIFLNFQRINLQCPTNSNPTFCCVVPVLVIWNTEWIAWSCSKRKILSSKPGADTKGGHRCPIPWSTEGGARRATLWLNNCQNIGY